VENTLEQIYQEHAALIYRRAFGLTGSREDAEDVLQTIFLKMLLRDSPPDIERNPRGYLYRAATNQSLHILETRRRHPLLIDEQKLLSTSTSLHDPVFEREILQRLYQAIATLSPIAAKILTLRYVHDATDAEIAKMLGVSRTVVAVRLFRSRVRLKILIRRSLGEKTAFNCCRS
jgi:RNA polymerase sigma-70 factor (ECF subfamily)